MDSFSTPSSLPWTIHQPSQETRSGHVRRSSLLENEWALRKCYQCHENYIPLSANNDFQFCSGDCRLSCSILRHNSKTKNTQQGNYQPGGGKGTKQSSRA